jgi:hypothetical protein
MHFATRVRTWRVARLYSVQCTVQWNSSISETVQNRTHVYIYLFSLEWPLLWPPRILTFPPGTLCIICYIPEDRELDIQPWGASIPNPDTLRRCRGSGSTWSIIRTAKLICEVKTTFLVIHFTDPPNFYNKILDILLCHMFLNAEVNLIPQEGIIIYSMH